jgi:hypothetical protein
MVSDVGTLTQSFVRHLRAWNLSPKTVRTYREACDGFARFFIERGCRST